MRHEARYWTWTTQELKRYFGIGDKERSRYMERLDFEPAMLSVAQPKQLVDTETHNGAIPVRMGEDGKFLISKKVEKMLGPIPYRVMRQAVDFIEQQRPELVGTYRTYCRMKAEPFVTKQKIAVAVGFANDSGLDKRLNRFLWGVERYLDAVAKGWEAGTDVYEGLHSGA